MGGFIPTLWEACHTKRCLMKSIFLKPICYVDRNSALPLIQSQMSFNMEYIDWTLKKRDHRQNTSSSSEASSGSYRKENNFYFFPFHVFTSLKKWSGRILWANQSILKVNHGSLITSAIEFVGKNCITFACLLTRHTKCDLSFLEDTWSVLQPFRHKLFCS